MRRSHRGTSLILPLLSGVAAGCLLAAWRPPVSALAVSQLGASRQTSAAEVGRGGLRVIIGLRVASGKAGAAETPTRPQAWRAAIERAQASVMSRLGGSVVYARVFSTIPYLAARVDAAALQALENSPDVTTVEPDVQYRPTLFQSVPLIGADQAWAAGYSGAGWTVAVLDTGVDETHPFLGGKVVSDACYSSAGPGTASLCPGGVAATTAPGSGASCAPSIDGCYHGTHVAGIAAGRGSSFSGVAKDATIISIQVFSADTTTSPPGAAAYESDIISGLERVYALRGAFNIAAVNLSLGGNAYTANCDSAFPAMKAAIDQLRSVGIATVVAAGNEGYRNALDEPACISSAISVGSTTKADGLSPFSNTAGFLHLLAPGSSIYSSVPTWFDPGAFHYLSGTSMATPHVTGAWAILKQARPTAGVGEILTALQSTGVRIPDGAGSTFPRISVRAALESLGAPNMSIDAPSGGVVTQPFTIGGWALDTRAASGSGVDTVHVYAYPNPGSGQAPIFLGVAAYGGARSDVAAAFGAQFVNCGFNLTVGHLSPGTYQLVAFAHSSVTQSFDDVRSVVITAPVSLQAAIDLPAAGSVAEPLIVAGWAVDRATSSGTGVDAVHVYAYPVSGGSPVFLGAARYGGMRPDVGAAFGGSFAASGYGLLVRGVVPGAYVLAVFPHSTVSGTFGPAETRLVTIQSTPQMAVDVPASGAVNRSITVAGWALDPAAASGTGVDAVHVWAYPDLGAPVFLGTASLGGQRPDVAALYGNQFLGAGFALAAQLPASGAYQIVVYAHSALINAFNDARAVRVITP